MPVHLLPKSEIANLKAKQASRDVAEGVKIATRVDGLRELWSKTEQDFEIYKTSTLAAIQKEIDALESKKEKLSEELKQMKVRYDSIIPEITSKQAELAQFKKSLRTWENKLDKREDEVKVSENNANESFKESEVLRINAEDNERITANLLRQATEKRNESQITLETAREVQEKAYELKKEIESALEERENSIKEKEKQLVGDDLLLMNERKNFEIEKIRVNDIRQTLLRSIQRIKEGKRP
jgi:chromosome segregation ATPase